GPGGRPWPPETPDGRGLAQAVTAEVAGFGGQRLDAAAPLPALLTAAIDETRNRFDAKDFIELGIGCEACHLGSRAHALDPEVKPSFLPTSTLFRPRPPAPPTRAELVNHTCLRCHTVLFSGYAWTWEGGRRGPKAGGSSINSGEPRDSPPGGGGARRPCTPCHAPHGEDSRAKLDALGTPAGNVACTGCHPGHGPEHTHHAAGSAGSACLACHMPRKNMGLALEMTRYHRIGSPPDPVKVLAHRPLARALCPVDAD